MHRKDRRAFQILKEFETNSPTSQRQLARKFNVSLGQVNATLKKLEVQGLLTVDQPAGTRNRYSLTALGRAEKNRLGREYVMHALHYYGIARRRIATLLAALEDEGINNLGFCGIGFLTEIGYICLQQTRLNLLAVIEDESRQDLYFDVPVIPTKDAQHYPFDLILVTLADSVEPAVRRLNQNGIARENIRMIWK